ncbi:MAG: alpha/beta hydrolase domain-containing protein [Candidatus Binatia bacterium]
MPHCRTRVAALMFALALLLCAPRPAPAAYGGCTGDCDGDRAVEVTDLVRGVNIALGSAAVDECPSLACGDSGQVTIACLIKAVGAALEGCPATVPNPTVEGPVTGGLGVPFLASTMFDLAELGYQQAEYFIAGTAAAHVNTAPLGTDGVWAAARDTTAAYRTRIVTYRPIDPADFNGTVVIEWLNVSGNVDAAPDWLMTHTHLLREGFAWVGVSAQRVGVEGGGGGLGLPPRPLKQIDPERYGSLSHPGDSFSYDIFSQVAQAVRSPVGLSPLGDLAIERVIAAGESQSAFRMVTYVNAIHPLTGLFDGYFIHSRSLNAAALSEAPQAAIPVPAPGFIRTDLDVPVMTVQTETDLIFLGSVAIRQADSDRFRLWEIAGTAHADTYTTVLGFNDRGDSPDVDDLVITSMPVEGEPIACGAPINSGPQHWVLKAAVAALDRWVRDGTPPPSAPLIETLAGPPVSIVRDANGNALGGIRTPQLDVPLATFSGSGQVGAVLCILFGTTVPFDEAKLLTLYPTRADYVTAFNAATDAALAAGFILPPDAALMKANAAQPE